MSNTSDKGDEKRKVLSAAQSDQLETPREVRKVLSAAQSGQLETLREVLARNRGAKDARNAKRYTPLHLAAANGRVECVELLLNVGADKDAVGAAGNTPLHRAAWNGHKECIALLLQKGANKNVRKKGGMTPLHLVAQNGFKECLELLLTEGADKNARNDWGWTPLHIAAATGFKSCVEILLKHNADKTLKTSQRWDRYPLGSTPAELTEKEDVRALLSTSALPRAAAAAEAKSPEKGLDLVDDDGDELWLEIDEEEDYVVDEGEEERDKQSEAEREKQSKDQREKDEEEEDEGEVLERKDSRTSPNPEYAKSYYCTMSRPRVVYILRAKPGSAGSKDAFHTESGRWVRSLNYEYLQPLLSKGVIIDAFPHLPDVTVSKEMRRIIERDKEVYVAWIRNVIQHVQPAVVVVFGDDAFAGVEIAANSKILQRSHSSHKAEIKAYLTPFRSIKFGPIEVPFVYYVFHSSNANRNLPSGIRPAQYYSDLLEKISSNVREVDRRGRAEVNELGELLRSSELDPLRDVRNRGEADLNPIAPPSVNIPKPDRPKSPPHPVDLPKSAPAPSKP